MDSSLLMHYQRPPFVGKGKSSATVLFGSSLKCFKMAAESLFYETDEFQQQKLIVNDRKQEQTFDHLCNCKILLKAEHFRHT